MMDERLLASIAKTILRNIEGRGYWFLDGYDDTPACPNPLLGLSVGDTVYRFSDFVLHRHQVASVCHGVGYYISDGVNKPICFPVDDSYSTTAEAALRQGAEAIGEDRRFLKQWQDSMAEVEALLEEYDITLE